MAESRSRVTWQHTSAVLALLANLHRDPTKTRPYAPTDFDPHSQRPEPASPKVGIDVLKQVFVDGR